jgi:predicted nucleic acid-binding protein
MSNGTQILVDSDAFVGLLLEKDAHHERSARLFAEVASQGASIVTNSFVVSETATVLSHRVGQEVARLFLDEVIEQGRFPTVFVTEALQQQAIEIFKMQESRGTSMTDCVNVAIMQQLQISTIFSFDTFYSKRCNLKLLGESFFPSR